jgi:hypothetical protein
MSLSRASGRGVSVGLMKVLVFGVLILCGCDKLFPEFSQKPPDLGATDGGAGDGLPVMPHIAGQICALSDLRDFRSCTTRGGVFRITVEETREATMTDTLGHFDLQLAAKLETATLAAIDTSGQFAPSIVPLRLTNGVLDPVAVPVLSAVTRDQAALQMGVALDPNRGIVLAWVVNASGQPLSGVVLQKAGGIGPFRDGSGPNQLDPGTSTRALGLLALFDLAAPTTRLTLSGGGKSNAFDLPVRGGALTLSTLVF